MSVHPIEFRYYTEEMRALFTEEAKLQFWLKVEAALAEAHARLGHIPPEAAKIIAAKASVKFVTVERVKAIEQEIHHDLMAMVKALTEVCGAEAGCYVHLGATSYDIEDTALALQLSAALELIERRVSAVRDVLARRAAETKRLVCVGRTHGQHAVPTTYGLKFAILAAEFHRHIERLGQARSRIRVGKMTGAVGTQASFGPDAERLQRLVMDSLGLEPAPVSNQVVQRDRHAEVVFVLALIAATCEKVAKEIRNLQRTEIGEVYEPFAQRQVGSSTMPQKRNPHKSERICSLSRIIRAQVAPALENVPLEHERDLTNSASERIIFPESFVLSDFILAELGRIVENMELNEQNIRRNLELTGGLIMSERVMLALVEKGIGRQDAHELVRRAAQTAFEGRQAFADVLARDEKLSTIFTREELARLMRPEEYIGTAVEQVERILAEIAGA